MNLCLIDVHGDIEGDFEWVEDLPKDRKEFLIAIAEIEKIRTEIEDIEEPDHDFEGFYYCWNRALKIINKHIYELKGENEDFDHEEFYNFLINTIQPNEMEKYRNMFLSSGEIVN